MSLQSLKVIDGATVAASTTNDPVFVELPEQLQKILIYVVHTGESSSLTVLIGSSPDGVISAPIQSVTMSSTTDPVEVPVSNIPNYLSFTASNADTVNATSYDVIVSQRA